MKGRKIGIVDEQGKQIVKKRGQQQLGIEVDVRTVVIAFLFFLLWFGFGDRVSYIDLGV